MYGASEGSEKDSNHEIDVAVFSLLAAQSLAPPCHGIIPGVGRLEGWIDGSRPLATAELYDPKISAGIARGLAALHSVHLPLDRSGRWIEDALNASSQPIRDEAAMAEFERRQFESEAKWLLDALESRRQNGSRAFEIVLCHNDLQEGNVLLCRDGSLQLIDFEYAGCLSALF